jgi:AraC family transcriptional regulator
MDPITSPVTLDRFVGVPVYVHRPGDVALHEAPFSAGGGIPTHVHAEAVVSLVLDGAGDDTTRGAHAIGAGDLLYTPAYTAHGYHFATDGRWFNVELSTDWLEGALDGGVLAGGASFLRNASAAAWLERIRRESRRPDATSRLAIDGALLLLLAELSQIRDRAAPRRPTWLRRVEDAIEHATAGTVAEPLGVDTLAALAGVNRRHLLRTFRAHHGTTVGNYVRHRRLLRARTALATANRPIAAIALDAGFADQAHFTRAFRVAFGETPGRYARGFGDAR